MKTNKTISNKKFGFFFSGIFFLVLMIMFFYNQEITKTLILILFLFLTFFLTSLFKPYYLYFPKVGWLKLGLLLSKFFSPIILAIIFFLVLTPIGVIMKIFKKKIYNANRSNKTYWSEYIKINSNPEDLT